MITENGDIRTFSEPALSGSVFKNRLSQDDAMLFGVNAFLTSLIVPSVLGFPFVFFLI